jgi:hypothetical protein
MSSLLSLPRELRDHIIEYVISSYSAPPQAPEHDTCSRQEATDASAIRPAISPPHVLYHAYGLLLANRQLNAETRSRLEKSRSPYSLDVMVVGGELWPSWTCCPARASSIDAVDVTLRFFPDGDDPFVVHVARTCRAVLRGRKRADASMHALSEVFLYVLRVCLGRTDGRGAERKIRLFRMDVETRPHFVDRVGLRASAADSRTKESMLFGSHRSLWYQFQRIRSYIGEETLSKWSLASALKLMILLMGLRVLGQMNTLRMFNT